MAPVADGVPDEEPGADAIALADTVLFTNCPEIAVVVEVTNVLGKLVKLAAVELTGKKRQCEASAALGGNVNISIVPDCVTVVSLQVVSVDNDNEGVDSNGVDNEGVDNEGVDNEGVDNEGVDNEGVDNEGVDNDVNTEDVNNEDDGNEDDANGDPDGNRVDERVITIVVPDSVIVVSLHVVSGGVGVGEKRVTTVVVPDCVIVVSLQVESQENTELGTMDAVPLGVTVPTVRCEETGVEVAIKLVIGLEAAADEFVD
ncbi:hypothetical protein F4861DRAFT_539763 [Xylaria intraflava]|nr:hypothetical protein F4861DRAFT_539763 [Xylaria intraflava]